MPRLPNGLDPAGLRPRTRLLVSYVGDEWWHERILLAQVSELEWVVVTKHGDLYIEDVSSWETTHPVGPQGGVPVSVRGQNRVRFDQATMHASIQDWLQSAEAEAAPARAAGFRPNGEGDQAAGAVVAQAVVPPVVGPLDLAVVGDRPGSVIWLAMESRGIVSAGDPIAVGTVLQFVAVRCW